MCNFSSVARSQQKKGRDKQELGACLAQSNGRNMFKCHKENSLSFNFNYREQFDYLCGTAHYILQEPNWEISAGKAV